MPNTDESVTTAAPTTTGEGSGNGDTSRDAAGGAPAGATTPPTVQEALARVIRAMPAIGKDETGPANQGSYAYRGIEAIMRQAQRLLSREGVVITPKAKLLSVDPKPPNAHAGWQDWIVQFTWTVTGPAGDRVKPSPVTIGVGRDNSDKGINKAQTQAFKYLLLPLLQVSDSAVPEPDTQGDYGAQMTPEEAEAQAQRDANPVIDRDTFDTLAGRVKALPDDAKAQLVAAWTREDPDGQPYLPTVDGSPRIGSLRRNDVLAAEALILAAEKAAGAAPAPAQAGESVADRAARMARERIAAKPAEDQEAASDAAQEPEGDAGDGGTPETADGPTAPVPEGTEVAILNDAGEPVDLATESSNQIAARLAPLRASIQQDFVAAMVESVRTLHHARVDAEIKGVPGQTVAEDEHIDHRRMRVSLVRLLVQARRQEAQTDG